MRHLQGLLLFVFTGLGAISPAWGVVGGILQRDNSLVILIDSADSKHVGCTGTLIASNIVLTAAHCAKYPFVYRHDGYPNSYEVLAVAETTFPPGMEKDSRGIPAPDLALLRLERNFTLVAAQIRAFEAREIAEGEELWLAGFGKPNSFYGGAWSIEISVISAAKARELYANYLLYYPENASRFEESMAASKYRIALGRFGGTSACDGDSGGPIYYNGKSSSPVVGVMGAVRPHPLDGVESCDRAYLQLFTPLAGHEEWIRSTLKAWEE